MTKVIGVSGIKEIINILAAEVIYLYEYKIEEIGWHKAFVESKPAGSIIQLQNGSEMLKEDWLNQAGTTIADLQARIDNINANL